MRVSQTTNTQAVRLGLAGLTLALGLLGACGGDTNNGDPTPAEDMSVVDMAPVDMGPQCADTELVCEGACFDPTSSVNHCGECGNACGKGSYCDGGKCACLAVGKTWCDEGVCTNTQVDTFHCGECGNRCPSASYCQEGKCVENGEVGEVVALTNETRAQSRTCGANGFFEAVGPLGVDETLEVAAQGHAEDMAIRNFFEHENLDGKSPSQRMREAGFNGRLTGENIACGQRSPRAVIDAWIGSDGHCSNMMNGGYTLIGVGFHVGGECSPYWVQNFGAK